MTAHQAEAAMRRSRRLFIAGLVLMLTGFVWSLMLQAG